MDLVIVESPSKAKTIAKYLGGGYKVLASGGHVRDLPAKKLAVNVHNNFQPEYQISPQKEATIKALKREVANCDKVYLATDPDREGEAISWHLKDILNIKDENVRIVFNEITKTAVNNAISEPHAINMNLVDSQQARRVLDRLVGYLISPVLSRKVQGGSSAGRVQSVALRMIVEREREIKDFKPEEYWNIIAMVANATSNGFHKAAFNDINGKKFKVTNADDANNIIAESKAGTWSIDSVKRAKSYSKPNPPFTTSTMQQDAVNKLNMTAADVMRVAQKLYEGVDVKGEGQVALVTYIRTDSTRISADAQGMAKSYILSNYGDDYYPNKPNVYSAKDNAQDAHEAIRPISLDRTPDSLKDKIGSQEYRLYKLVYERFLASQMTNAEYDTLTVRIKSVLNDMSYGYMLKGKTLTFAGFTAVYQSVTEEEEEQTSMLPMFTEKEDINCQDVKGEQKFTKPPLRFTDSSIIKAMEENGIGRPSTYASILSVLLKRLYTAKEAKFIVPSDLGEIVCDLLIKYFPDIMDTKFTAAMETKLDVVAEGDVDWHNVIKDFYPNFIKCVEQANDGERVKIEPIETDIVCDRCGKKMFIKVGKYGKFLGCGGYPDCNNIRSFEEYNQALANGGELPITPTCDKCGSSMVLRGNFYGCSAYPKCKNTINVKGGSVSEVVVDPKDAPKCEKCGETMVLKSKGNSMFYACPGYPKCKNIKSYAEPVANCPLCGGKILKESSYGKNRYKCDNAECKFFSYSMPSERLCPECKSIMKIVDDGGEKKEVCLNKMCDFTAEVK